MSKLTVEELEEQASKGLVIKEVVEVKTYRDPDHPDVIRKVCPYCGRVFDNFLLMHSGLIGCRDCATKRFAKRCAQFVAKNAVDKIPELVATAFMEGSE